MISQSPKLQLSMNTLISTPFKLQFGHHFQTQHAIKTKTRFPNSHISLTPKKQRPILELSSNAQHPLTEPSNEEATYAAFEFEDVVEKDWSFLEPQGDSASTFDRIISAGEIEETGTASSKVVVSLGCEAFVDRLVELKGDCCKLLLVVHDAVFVLACVKEKYDKVKCWQGEFVLVPEKWAPLDVVFLYFLPGLPFELDGIFAALAQRCSPGARVVISHPQGRQVLEQQKKQHSDIVVSDLPDKVALEKVADEHSFSLSEFVDEPEFYLAVLKFSP